MPEQNGNSFNRDALLNREQREAVHHTEGPLLILAGAGSGKTRVLTHRIAYLIEEKGVLPYHIMAITFTNKAAEEMKNRVLSMVDYGDAVWVMTFHATCVRILRRFADRLGYGNDFTIYDTDDQRTLLKHAIQEMNLDPKIFKERAAAARISDWKNEAVGPAEALRNAGSNYYERVAADIYQEYEKRMRKNNAMDFDDLLLNTVRLFREDREVLENYQERFRYIMVDEYQDTNHVQFELIRLLSEKYQNICVVGDDDQSIYRFRGADIRNILEFEQQFRNARVIRLEQNYRSTTSILDCANAVIRNNRGRKEKKLWSERGKGAAVTFRLYENGYEEAEETLRMIRQAVVNGALYSDFAILYRTNAQSRAFEERCINMNVPYRIVGGVNFYQRAEIKDLIAYLKTVASGRDDISVRRILNVPKRGIGQATVERVAAYAAANGMSFFDAVRHAGEIPGVERAKDKLLTFAHLIGELKEEAESGRFDELIRNIIARTDYYSTLEDLDREQADSKKENIEELISKAKDFEDNWEGEEEPELIDLLEDIALVADVDSVSEDEDRVLLMTLHSSKGLEFPTVFLCGMEDGLFPSYMSLDSGDPTEIEEERRLCYVGITRAKDRLVLSAARARTVRGEVNYNKVSRFIEEIPEEYLERGDERRGRQRSFFDDDNGYAGDFGAYRSRRNSSYESSYGERSSYGGSGFPGNRSSGGRSGSSSYGSGSGASSSYGSSSYGGAARSGGSGGLGGKPSFGKNFSVEKPSSLSYGVGDRVHHLKFGDGTVKEIVDGKKDYEVLVDFDTAGEKRMFASFAKLKKI